MNAAQEKLRNVDTEAAARREAYEQQAEAEKQQLLADAQKQADAIVAEGKAAPRPSASTSCAKPTPRPPHWPARCARSCWPAT